MTSALSSSTSALSSSSHLTPSTESHTQTAKESLKHDIENTCLAIHQESTPLLVEKIQPLLTQWKTLGGDINAFAPLFFHLFSKSHSHQNVFLILKLFVEFVEQGLDINAIDSPSGNTFLHYACDTRYPTSEQLIDYLLDHGAVVMQNNSGDTPLHFAAASTRIQEMTTLLRHQTPTARAHINTFNKGHTNPLFIALEKDLCPDIITCLLENGADIYIQRNGTSPLECAQQKRYYDRMGALLIAHHQDRELVSYAGANNLQKVQELLNLGANPNCYFFVQPQNGGSAWLKCPVLIGAVEKCSTPVFRLLLENAHIDVNATATEVGIGNSKGTALMFLFNNLHRREDLPERVDMLLAHPSIDVNIRLHNEASALTLLLKNRSIKADIQAAFVRKLLEKGARTDITVKGQTVLDLANETGNPQVIALLEPISQTLEPAIPCYENLCVLLSIEGILLLGSVVLSAYLSSWILILSAALLGMMLYHIYASC